MGIFLRVIITFGAIVLADSEDLVASTRTFWQPIYQYDAHEFVDSIIKNVRQKVIKDGLDDINLPDITIKLFNHSLAIRNHYIIGMANVYRIGDVKVTASLFSTRYRSAFAVYNVSSDADVAIHTDNVNYSEGHIHMGCDNVTAYQVFKRSHIFQSLTLDEFGLTIGECNYNVIGLGDRAEKRSAMLTTFFAKMKDPVLKVFSFSFRFLLNKVLAKAVFLG